MTALEIANLRLKCAEPYIMTGSKTGLTSGEVFEQAEKLYQFITKDLNEAKSDKRKP